MQKHVQHVKYCLLGYGYASLLAYHKLALKHKDIMILKRESAYSLFTMEHDGLDFSPLPIYPVAESELYNSSLFKNVPQQKPITVNFSSLENFNFDEKQVTEGSLASFMIDKQGVERNLCLGIKQWGEEMLTKPLSQVQSKIKKHYMSSLGNTRMGYVNGKSLYKYAIEQLEPNVWGYEDIINIDIEKKEIHLNNGIISYDTLISTIPLRKLLPLCVLEQDHDTSHAGALFYFFEYDAGFKENEMIYDCDYNSAITRIFSIKDNFLLAQLGENSFGTVSTKSVQQRIQQLVPGITNLQFAKELYVPMAYPLESITEPKTLQSLDTLKRNNILPFGRFGNWEYSDLHELAWSKIESLSNALKTVNATKS